VSFEVLSSLLSLGPFTAYKKTFNNISHLRASFYVWKPSFRPIYSLAAVINFYNMPSFAASFVGHLRIQCELQRNAK
jgi:hypothetical protein